MDQKQNPIEYIEQSIDSMSKRHRQIAQYILSDYDKAAFMTAGRLAKESDVSEATVVRFAGALGFDGYPQLQRALQEVVRSKLTTLQRMELTGDADTETILNKVLKADMNNIRATIDRADPEVFEKVVNALLEAKSVYIVGLRSAAPLAQFLKYYLSFVLSDVKLVTQEMSGVSEQLIRIREGDACIGISFPRYSKDTAKAMRFAKDLGALTVALTDNHTSPISAIADYVLFSRSDMVSFVDSLVAPMSLINALIVAMGMQRYEQLQEQFSKLEAIFDQQDIYTKE